MFIIQQIYIIFMFNRFEFVSRQSWVYNSDSYIYIWCQQNIKNIFNVDIISEDIIWITKYDMIVHTLIQDFFKTPLKIPFTFNFKLRQDLEDRYCG